jgi:hypothetical protein
VGKDEMNNMRILIALNHRHIRFLVSLILSTILFYTHPTRIAAQSGLDFDQLPSNAFDFGYAIDVYIHSDGGQTLAVSPRRTSRNIYILDENLNQIVRLDPSIDPSLAGVAAFGTRALFWSDDGTKLAVSLDSAVEDYLQIWDMTRTHFKIRSRHQRMMATRQNAR